jgi:hypothetical protein
MRASTAGVAAGVLVLASVAVLNSRRAAGERTHAAPLRHIDRVAIALPPPGALGCADWPGMSVEQEAAVALPTTGHPHRSVVSWHCVDQAGSRHPSMVMVAEPDPASGNPQVVSVLVRLSENLHLRDVGLQGRAVVVTASYWGSDPGHFVTGWREPGGLVRLRFTTVDGRRYVATAPQPVAPACGVRDLSAHVLRGPGPAGASWLIRLQNVSQAPCVLEGYPMARPQDGLALVSRSWLTMYGTLGGVRAAVPPILLVGPGGFATSLLEQPAEGSDGIAGLCTADNLAVGTPNGDLLRVVPVTLGWCNPEVHPLIAGLTGSAL